MGADDGHDGLQDGIHRMVPRERMPHHVRTFRDNYAMVPGAPLYRREFGYYCMDAWRAQGLAEGADLAAIFQYDPPAKHSLGELGWCEAAFVPGFDEKIIEDRGRHEVVQDHAGRHLLCFKGRRNGFMPEYLDHPVKDMGTWVANVKWRLDAGTPQRWSDLDERMGKARAAAAEGMFICQHVVGGYMYLRSLIGPEGVMYAFYDMPDVVHDCMQTWLSLGDAVIEAHQRHVTLDEIFLAEDICYNHGLLCSPETMRRFLLPYYRQLVDNARARQIDRDRHMFVQVDTDGMAVPTIGLYAESIALDVMSPFEAAAGCDVVAVGRQFADLVITGGIDKRVLARGKKEIDEMLERIIPPMRQRGGYIPTCDHGVPAEVPLENYFHYRKRCVELGG